MTKQKDFFFKYVSCTSLLLHAVRQMRASRATAHLAIEILIRCTYKLLKSFLVALIFVAMGNFTFDIVTSVSNFAN